MNEETESSNLLALKILKRRPCEECSGKFDYSYMEFYHNDPMEKNQSLSKLLDRNQNDLLREIEGCLLLCKACIDAKIQIKPFKFEYLECASETQLIEGEPTRICKKCNIEKNMSSFYKRGKGYVWSCKSCVRNSTLMKKVQYVTK